VHADLFPRIVAIQRALLEPFSPEQRERFSECMDLLQAQVHRLNQQGPA